MWMRVVVFQFYFICFVILCCFFDLSLFVRILTFRLTLISHAHATGKRNWICVKSSACVSACSNAVMFKCICISIAVRVSFYAVKKVTALWKIPWLRADPMLVWLEWHQGLWMLYICWFLDIDAISWWLLDQLVLSKFLNVWLSYHLAFKFYMKLNSDIKVLRSIC